MNNPVIQQMLNRRSIRMFSGEPVNPDHLQQILQAAQQAPSSINAQQISLIVTQDKDQLQKIAEIAGGQPHIRHASVFITVVIDFNRTAQAAQLAGQEHQIEQYAEGVLVGAVDAGIMLNALETAASSFGYGCTLIGGIRRDPQALIELLKLPARTFPINGICIGVPDAEKMPQRKPRLPLEGFAMSEQYTPALVQQGIAHYDAQLRQWWDQQNLQKMPGYSQAIASFYQRNYAPEVQTTLIRQGFNFK